LNIIAGITLLFENNSGIDMPMYDITRPLWMLLKENNRVIPAIIFSETFLLPPGNKGNAPIINS
jgi:hypothetical protein